MVMVVFTIVTTPHIKPIVLLLRSVTVILSYRSAIIVTILLAVILRIFMQVLRAKTFNSVMTTVELLFVVERIAVMLN